MYGAGTGLDCNPGAGDGRRDTMTTYVVTLSSRRPVVAGCPFCHRTLPLTFHHLVPRKLHRRPRFRRQYSREALGRGIYVCRDCHDAIHRTYDEMGLAKSFDTPEKLAADPALQRHFAWLARQRRRHQER